jgi:hypothetical protein
MMSNVLVVTGFVPIPDHPRAASTYHELGRRLTGIKQAPVQVFQNALEDTWLRRLIEHHPLPITHAIADNPAKNTLAYHCVVHQKTAWMVEGARLRPDAEVIVWIDYGILHLPDVTVALIDNMLARARAETQIAIPGCWPKTNLERIDLSYPCWRFCGGAVICHREYVERFHQMVREDVEDRIRRNGHVSWEVNTWARVEARGQLPVRWYAADHNSTMFTGYASP